MSDVRCHYTGYVWHGEPLEVCESDPPEQGSLWGMISCWWNCPDEFHYDYQTDACTCVALQNNPVFIPAMWRGR